MKATLRCAAILCTSGLVVALVVSLVPGAGSAARGFLGYRLRPTPGSVSDALSIAAHNGTWMLEVGLLGSLRRRIRRRWPIDTLVYTVAGANAALVGLAIGAYGAEGLPYLPHLPPEALAVAATLCGYRTGSSRYFGSALVLTLLAAGCESFLVPQ